MMVDRIRLQKEDFIIPLALKDEDVELSILLRNVTLAKKVMNQILSDQEFVEVIIGVSKAKQ